MRYVVGIDPGLSGAVARLGDDSLTVEDVPTFEVKRNGKTKRELNLGAYWDVIWRAWAADGGVDAAFVEQVGPMPKQGVSSSFSFGGSYYAARVAVTALAIPLTLVPPSVWKPAVGIKPGALKDESRRRATELFPAQADLFKRVKDDGRAEAALIAYYGRKKLNG